MTSRSPPKSPLAAIFTSTVCSDFSFTSLAKFRKDGVTGCSSGWFDARCNVTDFSQSQRHYYRILTTMKRDNTPAVQQIRVFSVSSVNITPKVDSF